MDPQDAALAFDSNAYTPLTVTVDGQTVNVRWYKELCYVANPVAAAAQQSGIGGSTTIDDTRCGYESMNVFVPESAFGNQRTPIYFAVNNAGWMASYIEASVTAGAAYNSATSNVGAALKAGYVFVDVANRSRGLVGADGTSPGKAPAAVVDAKAAVRYLRLNDAAMPGSAERIVVNGTSGGGALKADPAHTIPALGENFVVTSGGPGGSTTKTYVNDWLDVDNAANKVRSIDMAKYLKFVATQAALKPTPAFDGVGVHGNITSGTETNLFGPYTQKYLNYTEFSWDHNDVAGDGSGLDDTGLTWTQYTARRSTTVDDQLHLINPMDFVGTATADTAPNWYVRNGTRDRDTSFIIGINLDRALGSDPQVEDLDFQLAWNQPHAGNYDVPEAMAWIAKVVSRAGSPLVPAHHQ
ncbi:hypothetical protein [Streptomyces collinus]|uniref:hypothetical protein n=1 Tax=Streptomyces collinus TaxID=42684 RepID=UPI003630B5DA